MSTELALFAVAKEALAEARRVDEVKDVRDEAVRMRLYGEQAKDRTIIADASEIIARAERKLGELIKSAKEIGQLGIGRPGRSNLDGDESGTDDDGADNGRPPRPFSRVTLQEAGISKDLSARSQKMAALDETAFEAAMRAARDKIVSGGASVVNPLKDVSTAGKKAARAEREQQLGAKQMALPEAKFGVILTDDEWDYETWSDNGMDRSASNHYPTSKLDELKKRDVLSLAAADAVLWMWVTAPHLAQGIELMTHRGFEYKTCCIWEKEYPGQAHGMGRWFWVNHEILLLGTRGNVPAPAPGTQWPSVIKAPVGEHSAKPVKFYELIEAYFPTLPKIELNARTARPDWVRWGYEAPEENIPEASGTAREASGGQPLPSVDDTAGCGPGQPQGDIGDLEQGTQSAPHSLTREQQDERIRTGYAADEPLASICAAVALESNVVKGRARRMGLSSRDRQRAIARSQMQAINAVKHGGDA